MDIRVQVLQQTPLLTHRYENIYKLDWSSNSYDFQKNNVYTYSNICQYFRRRQGDIYSCVCNIRTPSLTELHPHVKYVDHNVELADHNVIEDSYKSSFINPLIPHWVSMVYNPAKLIYRIIIKLDDGIEQQADLESLQSYKLTWIT